MASHLDSPRWRDTPARWRTALVLSAITLSAVNWIVTAYSELFIAQRIGAIEQNAAGWTRFSTPAWMFGSMLGPAFRASPWLFLALLGSSGAVAAWIIVQSWRLRRFCGGKKNWILVVAILLWIVRVPLPGHWTVYYQFAVRY